MSQAIEDIYRLSPLQQGMLFHCLRYPGGQAYMQQLSCTLHGQLDTGILRGCWDALVQAHPVLRTSFHWEELDHPVQVIHSEVVSAIHEQTWSQVPAGNNRERLQAFCREDLAAGFVLEHAPLARLAILHAGDDTHHLVFTFHHLILDGWSLHRLVSLLLARYAASVHGASIHRETAQPYRSFIEWLDRFDLQAAEQYWRRTLDGVEDPSLLAGGPSASRAQDALADELWQYQADEALTGQLKRLARDHHVTTSAVLHTAWALVVARHTDRDDVLIGSTSSGRPPELPGVENMIGVFINTLPVRVRLRDGETVRELVVRLQREQAEQRAYEPTPLVEVQRWSGLAPGTALFDTLLVIENYPAADEIELPRLAVRDLAYLDRSSIPLTLVARTEPLLTLRFTWDSHRFSRATVQRLCGHLVEILRAMVADPGQVAVRVPMLDEAERRTVLETFNATKRDYGPALIPELLEQQAMRTPGATAVVFGAASLTYGELALQTNRLARWLRERGVGRNTCVGVFMERSIEMVVGILSVIKAGGAYLPIDPALPAARVQFMLETADAALVLTQGHLRDHLPAGAPSLALDQEFDRLRDLSLKAIDSGVSPQDSIYVIFTSGSTGQPKGAANTHLGVANRILWMQEQFGLTGADAVLQKTPFGFDVSAWEFLWPLITGARLVLAAPQGHQDPEYLIGAIDEHAITTVHFVPSMLEMFLLFAEALPRPRCASLRRVMASGEALSPALRDRFHALLDGELHNLYGPTEAAIDVTHWACDRAHPATSLPIGRPLANTQLYVLDRWRNPAPTGVPGELYIGGVGVAKGYVKAPELTARAFVPDPFARAPESRLFRTGDVVQWRADGNLEFLGRRDHQIKLRGFRIELGEIEAALRRYPGVRECAVIAAERATQGAQLVAYVVAATPGIDQDALRAHLAAELPAYMVPPSIMELPALPKSPNGKLDRRALPALAGARKPAQPTSARTPTEELLHGQWRELLGIDEVGVDEDFFQLGGHSLMAMQLISRIRRATGKDLPISALLEGSTVRQLARRLDGLTQAAQPAAEPATIAHDAGARFEPFPLTDVQHAYWIGRNQELELGGVTAHLYLELDGEHLDVDRLQRCCHRLIERHDMLRAVVAADGRQRVLATVPAYRIERRDLRGDPAPEHTLTAVRAALSHRTFSAEQWPPFGISATLLDDGRVRLHVDADVLVIDAWSARILFDELGHLYDDESCALPPLDITFRDCVLALQESRTSEAYRRAAAYWAERVPSLPPAPELPLACEPAAVSAPRFCRLVHTLAAPRWKRLQQRAARAGTTPSAVVLAVFAEVLEQWSASNRFMVNVTLFRRPDLHPHIGRVVGDFTSITLLEVDGGRGNSFEERTAALQRQFWRDLDHREVGGVEVLRMWRNAHGLSPGAAMPVVFTSTLGQWDAGDAAQRGLLGALEEVFAVTQTPQVWLDCQVSELHGALHLKWDHVEQLFPEGLIADMFAAMCRLLDQLVDDQASWEQRVPPLLGLHDQQTRERRNATRIELPRGLLHEPLLAQARSRPEAVAVIGARTLTFGELERRSRALALRLRALGARPETLVGVVMHKGWEQVVAVLAVLRAGAAYLPVEASLPPLRCRTVLEQGKVTIILTQPGQAHALDWPADRVLVVAGDGDDHPPPLDEPAQATTDLAYVIFTSGSTGVPKGVMIDHRGARNTIEDINARFHVGPGDRVLGLSALGFDLSVYDIFGVLGAGGTLVLPQPEAARDPEQWLGLLQAHGVTLWNSVPALLSMLVEYARGRGDALTPPALRLVLLSGDWIPVSLPGEARRLAPGVELVSLGGATEASIWSIAFSIGQVPSTWTSIPYGYPLANQTFHILDQQLRPRPRWVRGELYIGGVGLARGYFGDAEQTSARFVHHPVSGEQLYRTGDIGRYLADGCIEFLGRADHQVKLRGHRIELGEIEAALLGHPGVGAAVADVRTSASGERQLVAYVVPAGARPAQAELHGGRAARARAAPGPARAAHATRRAWRDRAAPSQDRRHGTARLPVPKLVPELRDRAAVLRHPVPIPGMCAPARTPGIAQVPLPLGRRPVPGAALPRRRAWPRAGRGCRHVLLRSARAPARAGRHLAAGRGSAHAVQPGRRRAQRLRRGAGGCAGAAGAQVRRGRGGFLPARGRVPRAAPHDHGGRARHRAVPDRTDRCWHGVPPARPRQRSRGAARFRGRPARSHGGVGRARRARPTLSPSGAARARGATPPPGRAPARIHGPDRRARARCAADHGQRQDRQGRASCAAPGRARACTRAARGRGRGPHRCGLDPGAGRRAGRRERQLLRSGRLLAADRAATSDPVRVVRQLPAGEPVPQSDRTRAGACPRWERSAGPGACAPGSAHTRRSTAPSTQGTLEAWTLKAAAQVVQDRNRPGAMPWIENEWNTQWPWWGWLDAFPARRTSTPSGTISATGAARSRASIAPPRPWTSAPPETACWSRPAA